MAEPEIGTPEPTLPEPAVESSLAEHEAEFGGGSTPPTSEAEPDRGEERQPSARDRDDQGKFVKPEKHRAKSQEATARDVPRIAELTKRLRDAEAERDALRARPTPIAEPRPTAPEPSIVPRETRATVPATATAKPKIDDFQDYDAYIEALTDWKIGEGRRQDRETAQREADATALTTSWRTRVDSAKTRYPDFEQVALLTPTAIPQGSLVDAWILEHRTGADVLYTLQQNPGELDRILALPIFDQVEALTLLGQRMVSPREPAVRTGAAATPSVKIAPRPPTPVRTSAVSASDEPPDPEKDSLAEHERFYHRPRS